MFKSAVITISDSCYKGKRIDEGGGLIKKQLKKLNVDIIMHKILPDDFKKITAELKNCSDKLKLDLVITTGGTGLGPRDITPEATLKLIDKNATSITECLRYLTLKKTKFAMISRGVAGLRKKTLIINLPGSKNAVRDYMKILSKIIIHTLEIIKGAKH